MNVGLMHNARQSPLPRSPRSAHTLVLADVRQPQLIQQVSIFTAARQVELCVSSTARMFSSTLNLRKTDASCGR